MKQKNIFFQTFLICLLSFTCFSQEVGIGTNQIHDSAILHLNADNKGLLIPSLDSLVYTTIPESKYGMIVYDTNYQGLVYTNGQQWQKLNNGKNNFLSNVSQTTFLYPEWPNTTDNLHLILNEKDGLNFSLNPSGLTLIENPENSTNWSLGTNICSANENADGQNVAIGKHISNDDINLSTNLMIGNESAFNGAISNNVLIGKQTGQLNEQNLANTVIGHNALVFNETGNANTIIGNNAAQNSSDINNSVIIGKGSATSGAHSNQIIIDNTGASNPLLFGDFDQNEIAINGQLTVQNQIKLGSNGSNFSNIIHITITNVDPPNIPSSDIYDYTTTLNGYTVNSNSTFILNTSIDCPESMFIGDVYFTNAGVLHIEYNNESSNSQNMALHEIRLVVISH